MTHDSGSVEIITGSMFSGKTEELIRRLRRATFARQNIQVFKPIIDVRYQAEKVASHNGSVFEAMPVALAGDIAENLNEETTVVGIDEAQFFDPLIIDVVQQLAEKDIRVLVAGLDMDFRGEPFGPMPQLLTQAEEVSKLQAICIICGQDAYCTQRLVNGSPAHYDDPVVIVGADELYEARCRKCHDVPRD